MSATRRFTLNEFNCLIVSWLETPCLETQNGILSYFCFDGVVGHSLSLKKSVLKPTHFIESFPVVSRSIGIAPIYWVPSRSCCEYRYFDLGANQG